MTIRAGIAAGAGLLAAVAIGVAIHSPAPRPLRDIDKVTPEVAAASLRAKDDAHCPGVNMVGVQQAVDRLGPSWLNCIHAANDCDDITNNLDCNPHADPKTGRRLRALAPDQLARRRHIGACKLANENSDGRLDVPACERNFETQGETLTTRMLAVKRADDLPQELRRP